MVGEQESRTSGTRRSGTTTVPQSYWWKKVQNMNARSRLQEVSGSLNCAEKFSMLVSCHRGYGSVAFYAVFSLFILTFLYTIWKIVSAHSRSARRPGSSNSTSPAVLSPTAHAPTGYASAHNWVKTENILHHFHQSVKNLRPFPQRKPSPTGYYPPENKERDKISSVNNNIDYPTRGNAIVENPSPTWPSSRGETKPFYNYNPGSLNTVQPPVNYPSFPRVPYPMVPSPALPYPTDFNPYLQNPFPDGVNSNQRLPFGAKASNLIPYNSNSMGIYNENAPPLSSPLANISYRAPYYFPTKNSLPRSFYDNAYYGNNPFQNTDSDTQTSPSPLISFLTESSHDVNKSQHDLNQRRKKQKKSRRKVTKYHRKKRNHFRKHIEYDYIEDIDEKNSNNEKEARPTRHRKVKVNRKAFKHLRKKYHEEKMSKNHHYGKATGIKQFKPHPRKYKTKRILTKAHVQHQSKKNLKVHEKLHFVSHKHKRTNILHPQKRTQARYPKLWAHNNQKQHFRRQKHFRAHHVSHRRQRHFFNFKLYRRYRKHHTVNDEVRGKWKISRHRLRTCKLISHFSTRGTVKITRASGHNKRFLHTLLICRPVRLRVRRGNNRRRYSLKYAQLCSKQWYVTKGVIHVHKASSNGLDEIPRYNVRICEPSYAHAMKLVPAKGKGTKVWNISEQFVRKMEKADEKKSNVKSTSSKNGHKHNHRKGKLIHHKKKNKVRLRERGVTSNKWTHHNHKTATNKRRRHHESKAAHHDNKHIKPHKLKKFRENKKTKHDRKKKLGSENKKKDSIGKTQSPIVDSDKLFYRKLLKVLKLAKLRDRKKANSTTSNDVFDSLEAVLAQSQSETKKSSRSKNNTKTELNAKKNKTPKQKASQKDSPKQRIQATSNNNTIQKLLAKILPAVVGIINGDANAGKSAITMVTTKPTKPTTTQTSTSSTPTSQTPTLKIKSNDNNIEDIMKNILPLLLKRAGKEQENPKSKSKPKEHKPRRPLPSTTRTSQTPTLKTKSNDNNIEDVMKNILPLLLKRAGKEQGNPRLKSKPKEHKPTRPLPSKQRTSQPKRPAEKPGLTSILASLGLGNLASNSLRNTIGAKETVVTNKLTIEPTKRSTIALLKTTLLAKIPVQPPTTRSTPTRSVTTIQLPPSLTHPNAPAVQSISSPAISQIYPIGLPPGPLPAPSSVQLPATHQVPSAISTSMSPLQSAVSPQVINSDPYSRSILCFGDSLTSGYYNHGHNFHPYSQRLNQLLNSGRIKYYVKTSGKVREMAHGSMARRLPEVLGNSSRFDWVIILGGTNDVAHVKNFGDDDSFMNQLISIWKPRIVRDIEVLHEIAHRYGARTVLLTIPETAYEAWPNYKTLWVMRNRLNDDLRDYARRSKGNVVLCDLANQLPRHSLSLQAQSILWNDHLHLTPYGYDKMAEIVYRCMKPYLNT